MDRILTDEKLPYYPIYLELMKLPHYQARQGGAMVLAATLYKLTAKIVREETLREAGEWLDGLEILPIDDHESAGIDHKICHDYCVKDEDIAKLKQGILESKDS